MTGAAWIALFQRIPTCYQDSLSVMTVGGVEIVLQAICSLDEDFLIVRGRTAGTQDTGRVYMLPLHQIDFVGLNKKLTEPEAKAVFGGDAPIGAAAPTPAPEASLPEPPAAPEPPPAAEPPSDAKKPSQISKSILLARLRARIAPDGKPAER
jgi:hypothetical protein